ncbi:MAG: MobC family plasmid mobilization relaxosome protein [bacterium]|nr:MobC family plasmid mobilization relaxosome protein [bacterium]
MAIDLEKRVTVRFTAADYQALKERALEDRAPVSELIRHAALKLPALPARRPLVDRDLINQLSRLGNNLNQLTRLMHQLHHRGLLPDLAPVLAVLQEVRDLHHEVARAVAEAAR